MNVGIDTRMVVVRGLSHTQFRIFVCALLTVDIFIICPYEEVRL